MFATLGGSLPTLTPPRPTHPTVQRTLRWTGRSPRRIPLPTIGLPTRRPIRPGRRPRAGGGRPRTHHRRWSPVMRTRLGFSRPGATASTSAAAGRMRRRAPTAPPVARSLPGWRGPILVRRLAVNCRAHRPRGEAVDRGSVHAPTAGGAGHPRSPARDARDGRGARGRTRGARERRRSAHSRWSRTARSPSATIRSSDGCWIAG
jgi:hypothetical protein